MDQNWERTIPYYELDVQTAQYLLGFFDRTILVDNITLLPDGKRNTNYKVTLRNSETPYLLRIFTENDAWVEKEKSLYERIHPFISVPELYFIDEGTTDVQKPYAVYAYLDGTTLDRCSQEASTLIYEQLGEALSKLHTIEFDKVGFFDRELNIDKSLPPIQEWYVMFFGEHSRRKLGENLTQKVEAFIQDHQEMIAAIDSQISLVHGDFRPTNIIVKGDSLEGVIDWEMAMAGHPIADIGQFLRYSEQVNAYQEQIFIESYNACARAPLPESYAFQAKIRDLVNLLQMLNTSATLPYKDEDMKRLISQTITQI